MRKVLVVFGGRSCENEISVLTGVFVLNLLGREKYRVYPVYLHTDGRWLYSEKFYDLESFKRGDFSDCARVFLESGYLYELKENKGKGKIKRIVKPDCVLNCCHGGLGEGGGVSAVCELNGIALASPSVAPSSAFMDKSLTKIVAAGLGVPVVDYVRVTEKDYRKRGRFLLKNIATRLKYPVIVKPATLGSSIGICVAKNEEEAKSALETAFTIDKKAVIEKYLAEKKDVNCAAYTMNGEIFVSEVEVACEKSGVYSFREKYLESSTPKNGVQKGKRELDGELCKKIKSYTKTLYKKTDMRGVVRMDFLVQGKDVYLSEVNTVPGSLAYYLFCERVTDARQFFFDLIEDALSSGGEKPILSTGILQKVHVSTKIRV